jgi:dCTP deaminase
MIVGHWQLLSQIDELFPKIKPYKVGASSCDVRVGYEIMGEDGVRVNITEFTEEKPYIMEPGAFLLVSMLEHTVVPKGLSCLFLLKSTMARKGMSHCFAGWIDPGWDGILTMEIKNYNQTKPLDLWPGMPIGQLIYMDTTLPGAYHGRYQHSVGVVPALKEIDYDAGQ